MKDDELAEAPAPVLAIPGAGKCIHALRMVQSFRPEIAIIFSVTACVLRSQKKGSLRVR
ncbi:MAG: hypothetical protein ACYCPD_07875 [Acidobacteriaceae bacterium]